MASTAAKKGTGKKVWWIIGGVGGFILALIILVILFGTPSADAVFKDMSEEMLKTKSVTITQVYKGSGAAGESVDLNSKVYMNMTSSKDLLAKGDFTVNMVSGGTPMSVGADFIKIGDSSYVRFNKLSSTGAELSASFSQIESKLKNNWVKVREGDNFASFAKIPTDSISSVLPTPFANLSDTQRKDLLTILQDKSTYTIEESSKVDVSGVSAYKYEIKYDKDQYNKVSKAISGYVGYFKSSSEDKSEIKTLTVWVDISTKRIIKMEFTGTSDLGNIEGTITFTGYNQNIIVEKPADYSIESELLN